MTYNINNNIIQCNTILRIENWTQIFCDNIFVEKKSTWQKVRHFNSIELIKVDEYRFGTVTVKSEI